MPVHPPIRCECGCPIELHEITAELKTIRCKGIKLDVSPKMRVYCSCREFKREKQKASRVRV